MTVRINKQKINLREKLTEFEDKVNFDEVVRGLGEYAGNIGIGATNPSSYANWTNVTIQGGTNGVNLDFLNSSGVRKQAIVADEANNLSLECMDAGAIKFHTRNLEKMRIDSDGNVGIGTTNPGDKKLYVDGPIQSTSSINYKDMEIVLPGFAGAVAQLFVIEADSHYMVTVTRGDTPSQLTICMVTTDTSPSGVAADVHIHEITNSGHYSIIYETASQSIRWRNDTVSNPPKINASVLKLK
jgi:hypothetical protein